jgi:hypothetical protein
MVTVRTPEGKKVEVSVFPIWQFPSRGVFGPATSDFMFSQGPPKEQVAVTSIVERSHKEPRLLARAVAALWVRLRLQVRHRNFIL